MKKNWFEVDREGLAKLLARRGKEFVLFELLSNAYDEPGVTRVDVMIEWRERSLFFEVIDDAPEGFADLSHAYTLFAESRKKGNPSQRGRFNIGDKLVLALCRSMQITTTKGTVIFDDQGRRTGRGKTALGSFVKGRMPCRKDEFDGIVKAVRKLVPAVPTFVKIQMAPAVGIEEQLPVREAVRVVENVCLMTEVADEFGCLHRKSRMTSVKVYRVRPDEKPMLFELGIPVMETEDAFYYDVQQKIPQTMDREAVTAGFMTSLRAQVLNKIHYIVPASEMSKAWAQDALESSFIENEAVVSFMDKRFGEKRVSQSVTDPESNKRAVSAGYTVVSGSMLSGPAWVAVKAAEAIKPAHAVTPSDKVWSGEGNPDAKPFTDWIKVMDWSPGMYSKAEYAKAVSQFLFGFKINVRFCSTPHMVARAAYGNRELDFNLLHLGRAMFDDLPVRCVEFDDLLLHELAHELSGDHLSVEYYNALTKLAARWIDGARRGVI